MPRKCIDAQSTVFFRCIEPRFNSFKEKIKKLSASNNIIFSEDVFMDTLVRCAETFPTVDASEIDVDSYFWIAYKQNSYNALTRNKFKNTITVDEYGDNIIDVDYNNDIDIIADTIKEEIEKEFGLALCNAWMLHTCEGYTYSELERLGYKELNLHNSFKKIKRFVLKIAKHNVMLRTLLTENNFNIK